MESQPFSFAKFKEFLMQSESISPSPVYPPPQDGVEVWITYFAFKLYAGVMKALPKAMSPIFFLAMRRSDPAPLWISLSTPPPTIGLGFAVFTIASTFIFTMLFLTISNGISSSFLYFIKVCEFLVCLDNIEDI